MIYHNCNTAMLPPIMLNHHYAATQPSGRASAYHLGRHPGTQTAHAIQADVNVTESMSAMNGQDAVQHNQV
jgi:hypothetical protein